MPNCPLSLSWCQIVRLIILVPNCPVPNCLVPNCPLYYLGAKLSGAKLSGAKLSYNQNSELKCKTRALGLLKIFQEYMIREQTLRSWEQMGASFMSFPECCPAERSRILVSSPLHRRTDLTWSDIRDLWHHREGEDDNLLFTEDDNLSQKGRGS